VQCADWSPRSFFADPDLVAERCRNVDVAAVSRHAAARSGNWNRGNDCHLPRVLHWHAAARGSKLRWHDKRLSLDVLVRAAVDPDDDSGCGSASAIDGRTSIRGCLVVV